MADRSNHKASFLNTFQLQEEFKVLNRFLFLTSLQGSD